MLRVPEGFPDQVVQWHLSLLNGGEEATTAFGHIHALYCDRRAYYLEDEHLPVADRRKLEDALIAAPTLDQIVEEIVVEHPNPKVRLGLVEFCLRESAFSLSYCMRELSNDGDSDVRVQAQKVGNFLREKKDTLKGRNSLSQEEIVDVLQDARYPAGQKRVALDHLWPAQFWPGDHKVDVKKEASLRQHLHHHSTLLVDNLLNPFIGGKVEFDLHWGYVLAQARPISKSVLNAYCEMIKLTWHPYITQDFGAIVLRLGGEQEHAYMSQISKDEFYKLGRIIVSELLDE